MICNNTSKGVLNTLQFVLIETGQTSEQRVTIVQMTTNQGICSKDCHFRSEILSNSTEVTHLKELYLVLCTWIDLFPFLEKLEWSEIFSLVHEISK